MKKLIKSAFLISISGDIKLVSESKNMGRIYEVGGYDVRVFKKKGRNLIDCTCMNHTKFCNESPFCKHKIAIIIHEIREMNK